MKTPIAVALSGSSSPESVFKPRPEFYEKVAIRRKRFGQIYRGDKYPTTDELQRLAEYLGVSATSLL